MRRIACGTEGSTDVDESNASYDHFNDNAFENNEDDDKLYEENVLEVYKRMGLRDIGMKQDQYMLMRIRLNVPEKIKKKVCRVRINPVGGKTTKKE